MLTLTTGQLVLVCVGAALGGAIYGVMGFAYGVVISLFIHHALAAPDVVFIIVGGSLILNLALLPRFWKEIRWRGRRPISSARRRDCRWACGCSRSSMRRQYGSLWGC